MNKPGKTVLSRILMASLVPFALIFALTILVVIDIIYDLQEKRVNETMVFFANNAAEKITDNMQYISSLLKLTSDNIGKAAENSENGRRAVVDVLHAFMNTDSEIYCAWFVFRPGSVSPGKEWYARSFLRQRGAIREIQAVSAADLDDPEISPWHVRPFNTGAAYFDNIDHWDYGIGDGREYTGTIAYPVFRDGIIIGTVGMDILYEKAFTFINRWQDEGARKVLLVTDNGDIIYSPHGDLKGRGLADLGYRAEDLLLLEESLRAPGDLPREMYSPFFRERSVIYLAPVNLYDANHGVFLYVDSPAALLYGDARNIIGYMIWMSLVGLLLTGAASAFATRTIVRPINRITRYAEGIANGSLDAVPEDIEAGGRGGVEVEVLGRSIRKMLENMHQNHQLKLYAVETEYEKKKLEETARAKTLFFANMSHELRTPMNAIVGISDILLAEKMPDKQMKYIRDIKSSSESLLVIIDDILDISKLETGKLKLVSSHFNLHRMLDNVASMTSYLAEDKNLAFGLEKGETLPEFLYGDEVRIRQILLNLLGNAVKFTRRGSVRLRVWRDEETLCFDVVDSGIGIRDEDKNELFNAFRQVDQMKNRNVKGSGLGLSITMSLTRMMGGTVTLDSEYGQGTVFHVRLPLIIGDEGLAASEEAEGEGEILPSARVQVVDDNEINLRVARGMLALFGLVCFTANSGREAIRMVSETDYDLVFMDHMMPEMDGIEATAIIRGMGGRYADLPIIAFTANSFGGARDLMTDAGMNDFLAKPIRKGALQKILLKWLPADKADRHTVMRTRSGSHSRIIRQARSIRELDVDRGLANAGDDGALYQELLRLTRENLASSMDLLEELEDKTRLEIEIHGLKGAFANIGALELSTMAESLEKAFAVDDDAIIARDMPAFMDALRKFSGRLSELPL